MNPAAIIATVAVILITAGILYAMFGQKDKSSTSTGSGSSSGTSPRDQKPS